MMLYKRSLVILTNNLNKASLRKHFRDLRQQLNISIHHHYALLAAQHFAETEQFKNAQRIACYMSVKSEMDVMPLIEIIWQEKKTCFLPTLTQQSDLIFIHYNKADE